MENGNRSKVMGAISLAAAGLIAMAGISLSHGESPQLSISRSNQTVTVRWEGTTNEWELCAKSAWDRPIYSNDVLIGYEIYETEFIRPNSNQLFETVGSNTLVTLPIDPTVNKFFFLRPTNDFPPFPTEPLPGRDVTGISSPPTQLRRL